MAILFGIKSNRGFVLLMAYAVIVPLVILSSAVVFRAVGESRFSRRNKAYTEAVYLAEAGVAQAAFVLASNEANYVAVPAVLPPVVVAISPNAAVTYTWTDLDGADSVVVIAPGITHFIRRYILSSTAVHNEGGVTVTVNQLISRRKTFTFQHAVFYQDDLEMLPGPNMTLSGRIHSNHDIYLGSTSGSLSIDTDYLYSAGSIFNKRKDSVASVPGPVNIRDTATGTLQAMFQGGDPAALDCNRADWTDESQVRWGGTVKSSDHGVTSLAVPAVGNLQPAGFYASHAGLKIVDGIAYNSGGSVVALPAGTVVQQTFFDRRENKNINVTNIDMQKLNTSGVYPANGLLYVTRSDASVAQPNGIRLTNGIELAGPLTIVSNDPVYVKGDYNKTNKKPAAVICDAVNLVSNAWNDATPVNSRVASDTVYNLAFITGIKATAVGNYNGGLENYPRLLENWTGKSLKIRGSFVELWNSQISLGNWVYGMPYYTAPNRDWNYDTDFNNSANLPPFTPFAVETVSVAWWKS